MQLLPGYLSFLTLSSLSNNSLPSYQPFADLSGLKMASYAAAAEWHPGEAEMQKRLRVPDMDNPTSPFLTPQASNTLASSPLIALGTLDANGRPWTTLWGGEAGFSRTIAQGIIGVKTTVDRENDPVLKELLGDNADGEVVQVDGVGKMVSGLTINLQTRRRVKLYGRMVAGALSATDEGVGEVQLVVHIEQSLGKSLRILGVTKLTRSRKLPKVPQQEANRTSHTTTETCVRQDTPTTSCHRSHHEKRPLLHILRKSGLRHGHQPPRRATWVC